MVVSHWERGDSRLGVISRELTDRNREIVRLRETGLGYAAIGRQFGITGNRAQQIVVKWRRKESIRRDYEECRSLLQGA